MNDANWKNSWNWNYYEKMNFEVFDNWLRIKGLAQNADLEAFNNYILKEDKIFDLDVTKKIEILEVGGGKGRVVDWLEKKFPKSNIDVLEVTKQFHQHLLQAFSSKKNVSIINSSLQKHSRPLKYDITFWMWAGILEMRPEEKIECLNLLKDNSKVRGTIVIDIPEKIVGEHGKNPLINGFGKVSEDHGNLYYHLISGGELIELAQNCNLELVKFLEYETSTKVQRNIIILRRQK